MREKLLKTTKQKETRGYNTTLYKNLMANVLKNQNWMSGFILKKNRGFYGRKWINNQLVLNRIGLGFITKNYKSLFVKMPGLTRGIRCDHVRHPWIRWLGNAWGARAAAGHRRAVGLLARMARARREALNRHHGAPKITLKGARHERGTGELVHGGVRSEAGLALAGGEHLRRSFGEVESAP